MATPAPIFRLRRMSDVFAAWRSWDGSTSEQISVTCTRSGPVATGRISFSGDSVLPVHYVIECDVLWRVREVRIDMPGSGRELRLAADGAGNWLRGGKAIPELAGAIDVDLSATPFTNTLPVKRLGLQQGQTADLLVAYVQFPDLDVSIDRQRYTCIRPLRLYRFESLDSDFVRDVEFDSDGLVVTYPGLFHRIGPNESGAPSALPPENQ